MFYAVFLPVTLFFFVFLCLSSLEENENEIDDLLAYFQQQLTVEHSSLKICEPEVETSQVHISGNTIKNTKCKLLCLYISTVVGVSNDTPPPPPPLSMIHISQTICYFTVHQQTGRLMLSNDVFQRVSYDLYILADGSLISSTTPPLYYGSCFCVYAVLPLEVLMYIFRWVVSCDLDLRALEQLSLVCRGFYICARWATRHSIYCASIYIVVICI